MQQKPKCAVRGCLSKSDRNVSARTMAPKVMAACLGVIALFGLMLPLRRAADFRKAVGAHRNQIGSDWLLKSSIVFFTTQCQRYSPRVQRHRPWRPYEISATANDARDRARLKPTCEHEILGSSRLATCHRLEATLLHDRLDFPLPSLEPLGPSNLNGRPPFFFQHLLATDRHHPAMQQVTRFEVYPSELRTTASALFRSPWSESNRLRRSCSGATGRPHQDRLEYHGSNHRAQQCECHHLPHA
jgi:hypothetical protein